jgi:hypothetical protein
MDFSLSSPGVTAALGSAAIAKVTVNAASNYTTPIQFTCAMPASLIEAACFVDPNSTSGTGQVSLTVNSTPPHPTSSNVLSVSGWFMASGGTSLACVFLLAFPRRKWRGRAMLTLVFLAFTFTFIGCGSSAKTDPGTAKGTYTIVVTGTTGSGSSQYQSSVNVPVVIQ